MNSVINNLLLDPRGSTVQIQDNYYTFNVTLINSDGNVTGIRHNAIKDLNFMEDLRFFYNYGYMVIDNRMDVLESAASISNDLNGQPQQAFIPFTFRNDGRDLLAINIVPQVTYENADVGDTSNRLKKPFALNGLFSIYDTEDILSEDKNKKFHKLYFHDYSYQLLKEKDSYFSTGKLKKGVSNTDRSIETGVALRAILQQALSEDTKASQTFSSSWDTGAEKIFYSSPPNHKAIDDVNYLLSYHTSDASNEYCPSLLRHDRTGAWTFTPIKKIQDGSYVKGTPNLGDLGGSGNIETFVIVRPSVGAGPTTNGPDRAPGLSLFANNFLDYSYAEHFQSSGMTADDIQGGMVTTVAHNYDFGKGMFSMDMKENSLESINKVGGNLFVKNQKGVTGKSPSSNLTGNLLRTQNKNIRHEYSVSTNQNSRLSVGRNQALLLQFFNNGTITFQARGKTDRTVGKFINIKRNDHANDNSFDNAIMGSYCIVKIEHSFINNQYMNDIIAVKNYNAAASTSSDQVL
jgi:hypothetical protein